MTWRRNTEISEEQSKSHGKYLLRTTLDEQDEKNIWLFYNVIRTVEETFKTLKSDLDIRPVFHKKDKGTKSHLNLAILAYWVVSTTKYQLSMHGINTRWEELLRIMSTQVRVTAEFESGENRHIRIRKSTDPEDKMEQIYEALDIGSHPLGMMKFVVHQNEKQKKSHTDCQEVNDS